jgi:NADPH2:quinone reductase
MKALLCRAFGSPEGLQLADVPEPVPSADQVLIEGHYASLNFPDILMVAGTYQGCPPLPFAPGMEMAGLVRAVGANVKGFAPGDRVFARTGGFGAFAEMAVAHQDDVFQAPADLSLEQAAGFSVSYGSTYHALVDRGRLQTGEKLLVLGAGGGTGLNAVEIGRALGAYVIAAAGTEDKLKAARGYGADVTINYRTVPNFRDQVKEATGGNGADVVFDPVGGDAFDESLRCIAWGGRILVFGFASGKIPKCPTNLLLVKGCELVGVFTGAFAKRTPAKSRANIGTMLSWIIDGKLKPSAPRVYRLEEVSVAMGHLLDRSLIGKAAIKLR